ncbi:MAG: YkgJ family cysteine cluster protein [Planctomycetota bacterium]|nr:YkgJ family cysteine cluster protein [Planctomycetota bacterium]
MDCRVGCGACCVAPSISSALPGMPQGKPAGVRCVNLDAQDRCRVWNTPVFPAVCRGFRPELSVCGQTAAEAMVNLTIMEAQTRAAQG